MTKYLNMHIRKQIISNLIRATFQDREDKLKQDEGLLALKLRERLLGKWRKAYDDMPRWLVSIKSNIQSYISVNVGGQFHTVYLKNKDVRAPSKTLLLEPHEELAKEVVELSDRKQSLVSDRTSVEVQATAVLKSVTTVKRLLEVWPEAKQYLPYVADATGKAMVSVDGLNAAIKKARGA